MKNDAFLDAFMLRSILDYDPASGIFRWRSRPVAMFDNRYAGRIAGRLKDTGYHEIRIGPHLFKSHRLAWLYMTGEWPAHQIDHINKDRSDNRFCNLRLATCTQNMCNRTKYSNNKSGCKGVYWHKTIQKFYSEIRINNRRIFLGYFSSKSEAVAAHTVAAMKYHGEFARIA